MTHTTQDENTTAVTQLAAVKTRLEFLGHTPALEDGVLTVDGPQADDGPRPTVAITCKPWAVDGGRLYLWLGDKPFVEVTSPTHVVDAALLLHKELAPGQAQA